jgi:HEPN domain-containing protein
MMRWAVPTLPGLNNRPKNGVHYAQQAAEKVIKALLIQRDAGFPYVHDIAALLTVLEQAGQEIPHSIKQAKRLTRYPGSP